MTPLRRRPPLLAGPVLAGALLVTLALGGCSAEPVPDQLAAPVALPNAPSDGAGAEQPATDVAEPAAATLPAGDPAAVPLTGDEGTPSTAEVAEIERFIRDYYAAANAALETGDVANVEAFSIPQCNCREADSEFIKRNLARGTIEGSRTTVRSVSVQEVGSEMASVLVDTATPDGRVVSSEGETVVVIDNGEPGSSLHALLRTEEGWKVMQVLDL